MRFDSANDTPCPTRLARFGFALTGDFRPPVRGELFICPTDSAELEEHEPQVLGACADMKLPHHIVRAVDQDTRNQAEAMGPYFAYMASDEAYEEVYGEEF